MSRTLFAHARSAVLGLTFLALLLPATALACGFGTSIGNGECRGYLTSGTQWTVPNDWNSSDNTIEAIGGGGAGGSGGWYSGGGGGGGAYARLSNLAFAPGESVTFHVGAFNVSPYTTDTYFNGTSCSDSSICAKGGQSGSSGNGSGGAGGNAAGSVGAVVYSGGNGGNSAGSGDSTLGGAGGGGAAGPNGDGVGAASNNGVEGGTGAYGDAGYGGAGGGNNTSGSAGSEWSSGYGAGGGGGGGGGSIGQFCGSSGGNYGGGGGGGSSDNGTGGCGGNGARGLIIITYAPPPSCSVTLSPNPSAYSYSGTPVTLSWSSSNASQVYINNIGWVGASGSTQIASQSSTDYSCYGYSSAYGSGAWDTTDTTLTVTAPPSPAATITASSTSINTNQSTNITADFAAGSGDALTADNIDSPVGTGLGADTDPDPSKTITFSTTTPGTYTFYARATSDYYTSWLTLASTTVTVTQAPSCTPSTQYICTGAGDDTITASSTDAYCNNTQTTVTTCSTPQFCESGSSECLAPVISFNPSGDHTGNLQVIPDLVKPDESTQVYWNLSNAQSCTVTGTNGDSWTGLSSPSNGETSGAITAQTIYTLSCEAFDDNPNVTETQAVNVVPVYEEI